MEFIVDKQKKLAQVWMSHADQKSAEKQSKLDAFLADCRAKKIFVCVFESGDGNLTENTKELLTYNYNNPPRRAKSRDDTR